jgi:dimethylsulfoniopropionate demethylase
MRGLLIDGTPCPPCGKPWPVLVGDIKVGQVTSAIWSPGFRQNVGLSLIQKDHWNPGNPVTVLLPDGHELGAVIVSLPFKVSSSASG